jgi:protein arginine kinase
VNIEELIRQPGAWLDIEHDSGVVVSSRIRLARNLQKCAFPGWAGAEECEKLWQELRPVLMEIPSLRPAEFVAMAELDEIDKAILFERHLISRDHAEKGKGSGLVFRKDEGVSVMVNEEDHLRLQSMRPGLDLRATWAAIDQMDSEIEQKVDYAFSGRLGYLTACPTNVGTGLRASVMLHLPGLALMNEINPIMKGLTKIGLAVRGLGGEGTEATGNMYQISNQMTLGEDEATIIGNLEQIVQEIIEHERNARSRLMEKKEIVVRDHVGRALGVLSNAYILSSKEALDLLSGLRLGIDLGILKNVGRRTVDELTLVTQPGHLQRLESRALKPKDRDRVRASEVRSRLAGQIPGREQDREKK